MQDFDMIEIEDFNFNHYINHYSECNGYYVEYNEDYECIEAATDCIEEILWN